jgi:hypothetical protein
MRWTTPVQGNRCPMPPKPTTREELTVQAHMGMWSLDDALDELHAALAHLTSAEARVKVLEEALTVECRSHNVRGEDGPCDCRSCRTLWPDAGAARAALKESDAP